MMNVKKYQKQYYTAAGSVHGLGKKRQHRESTGMVQR